MAGEEPIDLTVADGDAPPAELGGDPPAVPVGQQADGQDDLFEERVEIARPADVYRVSESDKARLLEAAAPPKQGGPVEVRSPEPAPTQPLWPAGAPQGLP